MEEDGVPNPPDPYSAPGATTTIRGNTFTVTAPNGETLLRGTFTLDETTTPKSITWTDSVGPDTGKHLPSSYTLTPQSFTFIAANQGAPRPTAFRTEPGQTMRIFARYS